MDPAGQPAPRASSTRALRAEKHELQKVLFEFQRAFEDRHGHTPRSAEERQPLAVEYARYKVRRVAPAAAASMRIKISTVLRMCRMWVCVCVCVCVCVMAATQELKRLLKSSS
jgi:hypothetical protein